MKDEKLKEGTIIKSITGVSIKILNVLGSGGQGTVYKVEYNGTPRALKWYSVLGKEPQKFYENVQNNIAKGSPDSSFLWMQDLTEWKDGTFGYIMDLKPVGYYELSKYLIGQVKFVSWKVVVDAALNIVMGFRLLHNRGQSYQDLNDGNFFINPKSGKVLIADNDNVAPNGENLGILGKARYMAPEIVRGDNLPNTASDRYSLSVILFLLFCYGHPLEGEKGTPYVMSPEMSLKIYGTEPTFIYNPENTSNRPIPGVHNTTIILWKCLPDYMKELFVSAFSQESMMKMRRVTEYDWLNALVRFRSDIVKCSCGNEIFTNNGNVTNCDGCGKPTTFKNKIVFGEYAIPAIAGTRIYRIQLGTVNFEDALNPVASINANPNEATDIRIKNLSDTMWTCATPSGKTKKLEQDSRAPIKAGIKIKAYGTEFEIQ